MKLAATTLLALVALAAPAPAATVTSDGATVTIAAPGRETNRIQVSARSGGGVTIRDTRTPVTAGAGCTQTRPDRASCGSAQTTLLVADLGPFGDSISVGQSVRHRVELHGGSGNDTLRGGAAGDLLAGDGGTDTVTYSGRPGGVVVTLAGGADDGLPGEGDDVVRVERAVGGNGPDRLVGTDGDNRLSGGPGDDRLEGLRGIDALTGNRGQDELFGGDDNDVLIADRAVDGSDAFHGEAGVDRADYSRRAGAVIVDPDGFADDGDLPGPTLKFTDPVPPRTQIQSPERDNVLPDVESVRGGLGADILSTANSGGLAEGGPGTDVLFGGPGVDAFSGEGGFDRIVSRDRVPEDVRCGAETDRVFGDLIDRVDADCELRAAGLQIPVDPLRRFLEGDGLHVVVDCPAQAFTGCAGSLRAETVQRVRPAGGGRPRQVRLGLVTFGVPSGIAQEIIIPFDDEARGLVARLAPLRVRVVSRGRDGAGPARPSTARLVLRG